MPRKFRDHAQTNRGLKQQRYGTYKRQKLHHGGGHLIKSILIKRPDGYRYQIKGREGRWELTISLDDNQLDICVFNFRKFQFQFRDKMSYHCRKRHYHTCSRVVKRCPALHPPGLSFLRPILSLLLVLYLRKKSLSLSLSSLCLVWI